MLLICIMGTTVHAAQPEQPEYIAIPSRILKDFDGTALIRMVDLVLMQKKIRGILDKQISETHTFKTLIAQEPALDPQKRDAILHKFIRQFYHITKKYIDELMIIREHVLPIMHDWIDLRCRQESVLALLLARDKHKSREEIWLTSITTLADFDTLLEDVHLFLGDLIISLPKSWKQYYEESRQRTA